MRITRLTPAHVEQYRAIMLQAYAQDPGAFTATVAEREPLPLEWWAPRVSDQPDAAELTFGAFDGDQLVGVAGLRFERRPRTAHKASLVGLVVSPEARGQGIARSLVAAVLDHARATPGTRVVQLKVTESNEAARRLYESCGFASYGTEPLALKVDDGFAADVLMWCRVDADAHDRDDTLAP